MVITNAMESSLVLTLILAVIVMALVVAGLSIGFLLTGKQRLKRGCGKIPTKNCSRKQEKNSDCPMCDHRQECEKSENEHDHRISH